MQLFQRYKTQFLFSELRKQHLVATKFVDTLLHCGLNRAVSGFHHGIRFNCLYLAHVIVALLDGKAVFTPLWRTSARKSCSWSAFPDTLKWNNRLPLVSCAAPMRTRCWNSRITCPGSNRFTRGFLVVTPGLTIRDRWSARAVEKVAASIREYGFRQPVVVDANEVIAIGHLRRAAGRFLGLTEIPVHVARDLTPAQIRGLKSDQRQWRGPIIRDVNVQCWSADPAALSKPVGGTHGIRALTVSIPIEDLIDQGHLDRNFQ